MDFNYWAIFVVACISFIGEMLWNGPLFGQTRKKIHRWTKELTEVEQQEIMYAMRKKLLSEFIWILLVVFWIATIINVAPQYNGALIGGIVWLVFILPTVVSDVIWSRVKKEWWITKILVITGNRLLICLFAGCILSLWK